jgi:serine phosphatase RsbU (regulator of sigma subunit)
MMNRVLLNTARRWRPEIRRLSGLELIEALIDLFSLIYWLPFAAAGLIWLLMTSDPRPIFANWFILLFASILGWIFRQLEFSLRLEVKPGVFTLAGGSFEMLVFWSLALLFGSPALWSAILMAILSFFWQSRGGRTGRWYRWRKLANDVAAAGLVGQIALKIYELQGGRFLALTNAAGQDVLTAIVLATLVWFVLPRLMGLPLFMYVSRSPEIVGTGSLTDQPTMTRFLLVGSSISGIADLFAILAALVYQAQNSLTYFYFLAGALLAALLANRLSAAATHSEQRSRALEILERMSRALMTAPELRAALPGILTEFVGGLFPHCSVEIRLFPDEVLFRQVPERFAFNQSIWQRLQDKPELSYLLPTELPDGNGRSSRLTGIALPIVTEATAEHHGAICLIAPDNPGKIDNYCPVLLSLANQISSALQRIQLQDQALEKQAEIYQREVYAQAYQAEVYAQALALERMTQELVVAGQIQSSFLPEELPDLPGWQMSVTLEPAREASGDFYDFIQLPNGRIGLVIADVADKGMGAALYMALSRTLIRTFALEYDSAPEKALAAANRRILADTHSDMFVTVFYAILDSETGQLTYCNAGHNPPFLLQLRNGDTPLPLMRTALPLGIMERADWECASVWLMPGDVLAMYTDGVIEAQNEEELFFGKERLQMILRANASRSADVIEDKIISAIYDFTGDAPQFDDLALMVVVREF